MRKYDIAVIIGRFQPFHNGHKYLVEEALKLAENVIILIGSANRAMSVKNPFTYEERGNMIYETFKQGALGTSGRLTIKPLKDIPYSDELWVKQVQELVGREMARPSDRVALVGYMKDDSSYYLKMFPQWKFEEVDFSSRLNATDMRHILFEEKSLAYLDAVIPKQVLNIIFEKTRSDKFAGLLHDWNYLKEYPTLWGKGPFLTADAVVIQQGHILLVRRGKEYGHGLWALPGGFVNPNERFKDAFVRELREETGLKIPVPVLKGSLIHEQVFDDPNRSERGRIVTTAFLVHLTNIDQGLPKVKGQDDAEHAEFVPLSSLRDEEFFEDHFAIISTMIGYL